MAEKGIVVDDALTGESVACTDTRTVDDDTSARIAQIVGECPRIAVYEALTDTPLREITATDALDIDPIPAGIASNLLDVSDATGVAVYCHVTMHASQTTDGVLVITPMIVSEDATPVVSALLPPMKMLPVKPSGGATSDSEDFLKMAGGAGVQPVYPSIIFTFPTYGAKEIGFHTYFTGDIIQVDLFALPISHAGKNSALDISVEAGDWGGEVFPAYNAGG